ncbi:hypothetical protein BH10CYA1_BH10CYA1_23460 [soil metagenome]
MLLQQLPRADAQQSLERCQICGADEEVHACLQAIPSSLLTLQDPRIDSVVAEHYILEEFMCENSTSLVYKARHQLFHTQVAVKISKDSAVHDPLSVLRTSRAALIAVRLEHPNIVRCVDFNRQADQSAALVMEWAHGIPLSQLIAQEISLTPLRALNLLEGLCEGLRYGQSQGVNHINLKPNGIIVASMNGCEQPRLLDFGLMKMLGPHTLETTLTSQHFKYASPEEQLGEPSDQRSTIYSLGMIFLDMLTGLVDSFNSGVGSNAKMNIPALVKIYPQMREAPLLDNIVSTCLAVKPSDRFQNIEDLSAAVSEAKNELERMAREEEFEGDQQLATTPKFLKIGLILLVMAICASVLLLFASS